MMNSKHKLEAFSIEQLDCELVARSIRAFLIRFSDVDALGEFPQGDLLFQQVAELVETRNVPLVNPVLDGFADGEIWDRLKELAEEKGTLERARWLGSLMMDAFEYCDRVMIQNGRAAAFVVDDAALSDCGDGCMELDVEIYGDHYELRDDEDFYEQPMVPYKAVTAVLVAKDLILTAGHAYHCFGYDVTGMNVIFDYAMLDPDTPPKRLDKASIYKCVEVVCGVYGKEKGGDIGEDWLLLRLDRDVTDRSPVTLSKRPIYEDMPAVCVGHPRALPVKYATGVLAPHGDEKFFYLRAHAYAKHSGAPVFDLETGHMAGILVSGFSAFDFRLVGDRYVSVVYPNPLDPSGGRGAVCVGVVAFEEAVKVHGV